MNTVREPNESDEAALKSTFEISENLELIRKFWETSYFDRKKLLQELTTNDYMKKFPAFNLYNGYELVKCNIACRNCARLSYMSAIFYDLRITSTHDYFSLTICLSFLQFILDADKILGQRRSNLPETAQKVLLYANRQKRPSPELKKFLQDFQKYSEHLQGEDLIGMCNLRCIINLTTNYSNDPSTAFQQLTVLKLLPYVMPNPSRKISKPESASYFLPYFKVCSVCLIHNRIVCRSNIHFYTCRPRWKLMHSKTITSNRMNHSLV